MSTKSKIKTILWKLANYNPFFVNYCKTSYNNFSSIGLLFLIQILIAFFSGFVTISLFFDNIFFDFSKKKQSIINFLFQIQFASIH